MSKVLILSQKFPSYHPKSGQPTFFVEKFLKSIDPTHELVYANSHHCFYSSEIIADCTPKHHTVRSGHRYKVGELISPRIWSGKPYNSRQIIIAPNQEIKKIWNFKITISKFWIKIFLNETCICDRAFDSDWHWTEKQVLALIASNDGLSFQDFLDWFEFPREFDGQIICWNENIFY